MNKPKTKVIIFILVFLAFLSIIFYYFGLIKPTCEDEKCFEEKSQSCSPSKYSKVVNNNVYKYVISRSLGESCKIKISLEQSSEGTDFETKQKLEGKQMKCHIPKQELIIVNLNEVENLLQYCTGPLKEGIYELIIKKMYGIILSNIGDILSEVQTTLIKKIE